MNAEKRDKYSFLGPDVTDDMIEEYECSWLQIPGYEKALHQVAWATLDLVRGISQEQKERVYHFMRRTDSAKVRGRWVSTPNHESDAFDVIKNSNWEWVEWTFWQPILAERNLMTGGMRENCHPQVYVFDLEKERAEFSVKDYVRSRSKRKLHRLFAKFPETEGFTEKEQFLEFLYANPKAFSDIIDRHVRWLWTRTYAPYDHRPKHIFTLLWETVFERLEDLLMINDIGVIRLDWGEVEGTDLYDDFLDLPVYRLSQSPEFKDKNPWQMPDVMPNVPGLYFDRN